MRKKSIAAALLACVLLAGAAAWYQARPIPVPATAVSAAAPSVVPAPVPVAAPAPAEQPDEEVAPDITHALKGRDFSARVLVNGNDQYRNLDVAMDNGTQVLLLRTMTCESSELAHMTFAPAAAFELVDLIPGEAREQIVYQDSAMLSRGEGMLDTYTVYRIEGDHLQELLSVITLRDREEGNGPPPQKLAARLERTIQNGQPAFAYHVKAGDEPEQTIVFVWNGKLFEDATGAYAKIAENYLP